VKTVLALITVLVFGMAVGYHLGGAERVVEVVKAVPVPTEKVVEKIVVAPPLPAPKPVVKTVTKVVSKSCTTDKVAAQKLATLRQVFKRYKGYMYLLPLAERRKLEIALQ
jgi:hypothetical protein